MRIFGRNRKRVLEEICSRNGVTMGELLEVVGVSPERLYDITKYLTYKGLIEAGSNSDSSSEIRYVWFATNAGRDVLEGVA